MRLDARTDVRYNALASYVLTEEDMSMGTLIAPCGLDCAECEAYKATQANDAEEIARVAAQWEKEYGGKIPPEAVWCDSCLSAGERKCGHCAECDMRACVVGRGLTTCAECSDYRCEKISRFLGSVSCAKERLDAIRAAG